MRIGPLVALAATALSAFAMPPLPRKSPDFAITDSSGKQITLSGLRGKVVVFTLMYTTCPHCQVEAGMVTKLQKEYGPRRFQAVGVVFNDATPDMLNAFVRDFHVGYQVGIALGDAVGNYLGIASTDRYTVPQIAVIDRKGMIRAQSDPLGTPDLQNETYLRNLIETLLNERGSAPTSAAAKKVN
jgi:cytochrome oxidase Cu insertion factor (SCO1/SenC/PrrC family)